MKDIEFDFHEPDCLMNTQGYEITCTCSLARRKCVLLPPGQDWSSLKEVTEVYSAREAIVLIHEGWKVLSVSRRKKLVFTLGR